MLYDKDNKIVKLCASGMELEGSGKNEEALKLFKQAWNEATNDFEKFTAAHYIARHQPDIQNKLFWDEKALKLALKLKGHEIKSVLPSLYLNVGRCYEDLSDFEKAKENYNIGLSHTVFLPNDGYGQMIKSGLNSGVDRLKNNRAFPNDNLEKEK